MQEELKPSTEVRENEEQVQEQKPFNSASSSDLLGRHVERLERFPTKSEISQFPLIVRIFFWITIALFVASGIVVVFKYFMK